MQDTAKQLWGTRHEASLNDNWFLVELLSAQMGGLGTLEYCSAHSAWPTFSVGTAEELQASLDEMTARMRESMGPDTLVIRSASQLIEDGGWSCKSIGHDRLKPIEFCPDYGLDTPPEDLCQWMNETVSKARAATPQAHRKICTYTDQMADDVPDYKDYWTFYPGIQVELHGLKKPEYNGQVGTIIGALDESGRAAVQLELDGSKIRVRSRNLRLLTEPEFAAKDLDKLKKLVCIEGQKAHTNSSPPKVSLSTLSQDQLDSAASSMNWTPERLQEAFGVIKLCTNAAVGRSSCLIKQAVSTGMLRQALEFTELTDAELEKTEQHLDNFRFDLIPYAIAFELWNALGMYHKTFHKDRPEPLECLYSIITNFGSPVCDRGMAALSTETSA